MTEAAQILHSTHFTNRYRTVLSLYVVKVLYSTVDFLKYIFCKGVFSNFFYISGKKKFYRENRFITRGGQPPTIRIRFQAPEQPREPTIGNALLDAALQPNAMVADLGEVPPLPPVLPVSVFFRCNFVLFCILFNISPFPPPV